MNPLTRAIDRIDNRDPFGDVSCEHDLGLLRRAVRLIERLGSDDNLDGLRHEARTLIDDTPQGAANRALSNTR